MESGATIADNGAMDDLLEKAEALRASGRLDDAVALLNELLQQVPGHAEAEYRLAQIAANRGDAAQCRIHMERAVAANPDNPEYWFRLGDVCQRAGDTTHAATAYEHVLKHDPANVPALIRLAGLRLAVGDREGAADACQRVVLIQGPVAMALRNPRLPAAMRRTLQQIQATLAWKYRELIAQTRAYLDARYKAADLERIYVALDGLGAARGAGGHELQRPEFLYFPGLRAEPWFDARAFRWHDEVAAAHETIRDEYLSLDRGAVGFTPYIHTVTDQTTLQGTDFSTLAGNSDWSAYHLNKAGWIDAQCGRCPQTAALMRRLPLAEAEGYMPEVFYSVLAPGTDIVPHFGQTNIRLTVHLGLIIPTGCGIRVGGETRHWAAGEILAFDDSFEHAAWNHGDSERVVLIFEAWHPDLTEPERDGLQHFFATRARWLARFDDLAPASAGHG